MIFQKTVAGSNDVDVVYGRDDEVQPVIMNWNVKQEINLKVVIKTPDGKIKQEKTYLNVNLEGGRTVKNLEPFKPEIRDEGFYIFEYVLY